MIEVLCDKNCIFNEDGICQCNWIRIWEGECESFEEELD